MGCRTLLLTMDTQAIGRLSCNPAVGGVAKGQLVRDIDALGGLMGVLADGAGIQFRMLNRSKGPAVWGPRAQMDSDLYPQLAQKNLGQLSNLTLVSGELTGFALLSPSDSKAHERHKSTLPSVPDLSLYRYSLALSNQECLYTKCLIITSGTFLGGVMYTGLQPTPGGRVGENSAMALVECLNKLNIRTRRLKTGTPARLHKDSIDYSLCTEQMGDTLPSPFSFRTRSALHNKISCWITHTHEETHDILRTGFDQSPMYTGKIKGLGPRYCPSIEDKIHRFADKSSHQLFLEPEGLNSKLIYVNGFSSSLPREVQDRALRTIPGLANCQVVRYGYAVEYVAVVAQDLNSSLEHRNYPGLYFAGQVNGTSGYEEAAAQGLIAGINAANHIMGQPAYIPARSDSYIGVMIDDLVSRDIDEPYRMFTSRAEYRLFLRHDNAEERLMHTGRQLGLVDDATWKSWESVQSLRQQCQVILQKEKVQPADINKYLVEWDTAPLSEAESWYQLLKRPQVSLEKIIPLLPAFPELSALDQLALQSNIAYEGFFVRQEKEIERNRQLTHLTIPPHFTFNDIPTIRIEARQALQKLRPSTVAECTKIPALTPADISGLIYALTHAPHKKEQIPDDQGAG